MLQSMRITYFDIWIQIKRDGSGLKSLLEYALIHGHGLFNLKGLDISAKGTMEEKLAWSFKLFDLDEDGYISKAEMLAIVDAIYRMVGQAQSLPDDEATATLRVEKVFRMMDLVNTLIGI
jgi:hypothetical protein